MRGVLVAAALIAVPALAFTLWPLFARRDARGGVLSLSPDAREQLLERKHAVLRALRELAFEHEAGHVADDDYGELRARYEAEAATILTELDRLGPLPEGGGVDVQSAPASSRKGWRHPVGIAVSAVALVAFGVALGAGVVRYTTPDPGSGAPAPGSRPLAPPLTSSGDGAAPGAAGGGQALTADGSAPRPITPEMLQGMLRAARSSLTAERYGEAIAAYQAVLKRDARNVDALTHLGLIVAIGGHADQALATIERALSIDPNYPPALLYRGQILHEAKRDTRGAIETWERYLAVVPAGEDRERVSKLIAEARAGEVPKR